MFKQISPQYAVDEDKGVSLEVTGPYSLRYTDNDYVASISSEPVRQDEKYAVHLYLSDLTSWDSPDDQDISEGDKATIERNIRGALDALGMAVEVE